jgi:hypothetical protein
MSLRDILITAMRVGGTFYSETRESSSYTPAIIAAAAGVALYFLSKLGELIVILLVWGAYAAFAYAVLQVIAAYLGVPLLEFIRAAADRAREFARRGDLRRRAAKRTSRTGTRAMKRPTRNPAPSLEVDPEAPMTRNPARSRR